MKSVGITPEAQQGLYDSCDHRFFRPVAQMIVGHHGLPTPEAAGQDAPGRTGEGPTQGRYEPT